MASLAIRGEGHDLSNRNPRTLRACSRGSRVLATRVIFQPFERDSYTASAPDRRAMKLADQIIGRLDLAHGFRHRAHVAQIAWLKLDAMRDARFELRNRLDRAETDSCR
jgi:hypothetical protein